MFPEYADYTAKKKNSKLTKGGSHNHLNYPLDQFFFSSQVVVIHSY